MNAQATTVVTTLNPYTGPWTFEQAAHLLRRTMYGPSYQQIKSAVDNGMYFTLGSLFEELPLPAPPVNGYYTEDPNVPVGETWVEAVYTNVTEETSYRFRSLTAWTVALMWEEGVHIREKLTLFWHNHFPNASVEDPKFQYRYIATLRNRAWGNFRDLTKEITIDPAMLIYLNGNQNKKEAPNENYGRELLELFTIGKGPLAGPGDYTHYNEQDVQQFARVLSGWRDFGFTNESPDGTFGSFFNPDRHDDGVKNLSFHFNNEVITNMNEQEYTHLIDIVFQQPEVARFICRKLYRWFLFHEIDANIEASIIEPMAQILIANDYEIKPALLALLASEHFYDVQFKGLLIKNPYDHLLSVLKTFDVQVSTPLDQKQDSLYRIWQLTKSLQLSYFTVPEVAGWQAYYREPLYYRNWLNSSTLPLRLDYSDEAVSSGLSAYQGNGEDMLVDVLKILGTLDAPDDPNSVVDELVLIMFPKPISPERKTALKEILIPGLPDFEWTVEYLDYANDPTNPDYYIPVDTKLRALVRAMISMPDFFLS
ncbi:MAG: DUF1800 domain-containing protein [Saprospirales bacterium]|nr:DUF1800 domain-containing protein [Saprospirales bacterium]